MASVARILKALLLVLAASAVTTNAAEKPDPQPISGKIDWVYDYAEGQRISRDSDRPMFVVFRCER